MRDSDRGSSTAAAVLTIDQATYKAWEESGGDPLVPPGPDFDGETYDPAQDKLRLATQLDRVRELMRDGKWRTLAEISAAVSVPGAPSPEASTSARLRDLRKPKFGAYTVERRRVARARGLWEYRMPRWQFRPHEVKP